MSKGEAMIVAQNNYFKQNFVQVLFYLINTVYKNHSKDGSEGENDLNCATVLAIYFLETFPLDMVTPIVSILWSYCKYNCFKAKSIYLKSLTSQFISILFWKVPVEFLKLLIS